MIGNHLHAFDLELCAYAVDNVAQYMARPWYAARIADSLAARSLLLGYLQNAADPSLDAEDVRLTLHDDELQSLETAVEDELDRPWEPSEPLHRRSLQTVVEVRDHLTRQVAEDWSADCARFAKHLDRENVRLSEGIGVVRDWVRRLRNLLRVMGAVELLPAPEGGSPTPTHRTPAPSAPNTLSPNPSPKQHPATESVPGLAAMLSQLSDAVSKLGTPSGGQSLPPEALSKEDAAKFLGVPVKTIEHLIRVRKIQYAQLGSQRGRVIPVEALRQLLQAQTQRTAQEERQRRPRR